MEAKGKRKKAKKRKGPRDASTSNGKMIAKLMHSRKIRGNPKDWCIIAGARLIDYNGSYDIKHEDFTELEHDGVVLVEKRKLHLALGDEIAARFWNRKVGARVHK
jgi:hypothetical protein